MHRFDLDVRASRSALVDQIWRAHSERPGSFISTAGVHCQIVVSNHQDRTFITLRGPETRPTTMHFPAGVSWFGIDLRLGAFLPAFPPRSLVDQRDATLPSATSRSFWLHGAAWEFPTFDNADVFIQRLERSGLLVLDPLVEAVHSGRAHGLSVRALQYRFRHATGLTRSLVRQIERAHSAADLLGQGVPILDVVDQAGYFDQAHLTRALNRFLGQTPAQIARGL